MARTLAVAAITDDFLLGGERRQLRQNSASSRLQPLATVYRSSPDGFRFPFLLEAIALRTITITLRLAEACGAEQALEECVEQDVDTQSSG